MNIHEYQAKELLRSFGVPTGRGLPSFTVDERSPFTFSMMKTGGSCAARISKYSRYK